MTTRDFNAALARVLRFEGGFVDHPADRGGPTNFGVTLKTYSEWRGRQATPEDLRRLDTRTLHAIYRERFWNPLKLNEAPSQELAELLFDSAVLHGPGRAVRFLQTALGVTIDGVFGPVTQAALRSFSAPTELRRRVNRARLKFIADIVANDDSQRVFLRGWMNRAIEFV